MLFSSNDEAETITLGGAHATATHTNALDQLTWTIGCCLWRTKMTTVLRRTWTEYHQKSRQNAYSDAALQESAQG